MNMKKDFYLVTIIGFLVGWLVLPVVANIGKARGVFVTFPMGAASVIGFSIFAPIALKAVLLLSKRIPVLFQFGKFAAVGTLNTLLNFAVMNVLILMTGIAEGWGYAGFTAAAFLVATTNSYFWNKFWTFQSHVPLGWGEYARFALFTLGGVALYTGTATLIVNGIGAPKDFSPELWANVGALGGVLASFLWNFLTYRRIVFRAPAAAVSGAREK